MPSYRTSGLASDVTAKATPGAEAPASDETPTPKDLSHIRVGPPFESKIDQRCGCGCLQPTLGKTTAIVENTRTKKKRGYLEECLALRPELLERREQSGESGFLA